MFNEDQGLWVPLQPKNDQNKPSTSTRGKTRQGKNQESFSSNDSIKISDDIPSTSSWTNLQTNNIQEILRATHKATPYKEGQKSPKHVRINEVDNMVWELNLDFDSGPNRPYRYDHNREAWCEVEEAMRDLDPSTLPVGKGSSELLKKYLHTLYTHVPLALREQIWKDINAIKMQSLVLDQRTFRSEPTMILVQDPETRTL